MWYEWHCQGFVLYIVLGMYKEASHKIRLFSEIWAWMDSQSYAFEDYWDQRFFVKIVMPEKRDIEILHKYMCLVVLRCRTLLKICSYCLRWYMRWHLDLYIQLMDIRIYMILNVVYNNNINAMQQKYFWYFHDCKIFKGDKQMFLHSQKAEFERHLWYLYFQKLFSEKLRFWHAKNQNWK